MIELRPSTPSDAYSLAERIRPADLDEVQAIEGRGPLEALLTGERDGDLCMTVTLDEELPIAMFGVAALDDYPDWGIPWMLCSKEVEDYGYRMIKNSREWIAVFLVLYPNLINFVDERNTASIWWLKNVGFKLTQLHPEFGVEKRPFWQFERKREWV